MSTTKQKIFVLPPADLAYTVERLEYDFPGYWYSISQSPGNLRISVGPHFCCPDPLDRLIGEDVTADKGFILDLPYSQEGFKTEDLAGLIEHLVQNVLSFKQAFKIELPSCIPSSTTVHRTHSRDQFSHLRWGYVEMLNLFPTIEERGFILNEIYLGACQLSVDASLRGTDLHGRPFDISHDLKEVAGIGDSINLAIRELDFVSRVTYDQSLPKG